MRLKRHFTATICLLALAPGAFAHADESSEVAEQAWSFEPGVVIPLLVAGALFTAGAMRRRGRPGWSWAEFVSFIAGWLILVIALLSPIHKLSGQLFFIHMSQHEMLMNAAAPLLVLSQPLLWMLWALPMRWREGMGRVAKQPQIAALWLAMTSPLFAWLLHGATLWLWHVPSLYQACLEREWVHSLQHVSFLCTALLFWWTLVHRRGALRNGIAVVYCFTTAVHTSVLGALMTFSQQLWYPIYKSRTAAFHLTPLQDQQLGGLIMWVPSGVIYIVLGLWLLAAWIKESERRVKDTRAGSHAATGAGQIPVEIAMRVEQARNFLRGFATALLITAIACTAIACDPHAPNYVAGVRRMTGGDPSVGRDKIRHYGCHGCHIIPGIPGARGLVGPPLTHWARRVYIAGELPNTPDNLAKWIQHPPQIERKTAMPEMGVSEQDSRDIAAYLYTLR